MTVMFQAGARAESAMIDRLEALITMLKREIGWVAPIMAGDILIPFQAQSV